MSFGALTDQSQPHTVLTVYSPTRLRPLQGARVGAGTYHFQGDLRPLFRSVRERRLISQGVLKVEYTGEDQNVSARTDSPVMPELKDPPKIIEPQAIDLESRCPDEPQEIDEPADGQEVLAQPVDGQPQVGLSEPETAIAQPVDEPQGIIPGEPLPPELAVGPSDNLEDPQSEFLVVVEDPQADQPMMEVHPQAEDEPEEQVSHETLDTEPDATVSPEPEAEPESQTVQPNDPTTGDRFFDPPEPEEPDPTLGVPYEKLRRRRRRS